MVLRNYGTKGVYEGIYRFNSKCLRKKEKYENSKMDLKIFFVGTLISNDNIIFA